MIIANIHLMLTACHKLSQAHYSSYSNNPLDFINEINLPEDSHPYITYTTFQKIGNCYSDINVTCSRAHGCPGSWPSQTLTLPSFLGIYETTSSNAKETRFGFCYLKPTYRSHLSNIFRPHF